ncbi:hypothetical protein KY360_00765 [Candidatus Woesearchaeota archaeon]|nr:hypothetical protein [Candidatus Woesearchaeota archaeon]
MNKTILSAILLISLLMTGCAVEDTKESCSNDEKDNDETDVDCGGSCEPCENGKACETDDDCVGKCSTNDVCYSAGTTTTTTTTTKTPTKRTQTGAELSEETIALIESKLKPNLIDAFVIYEHFKTMTAGESHTFGIGVENVMPTELIFKVEITFEKAIDSYSNSLTGVNGTYVLDWLEKTEFISRLPKGEHKVWPLNVKIKDVARGVKAKPGTYSFILRTYSGDDPTLVDDKYGSKKTLAIRVK